ncbi:MAG: hypothetical protein ACK58L_12770, partial [Planctomycetota bacterium]
DTLLTMRDTTNFETLSISFLPTLLIKISEALTKATPEGEILISGFSNFASGMRIVNRAF